MRLLPTPSQAAIAAGVPARYHYWMGRSGRRYLFTAAEAAELADFGDGLAIAVSGGAIIWAGEVSALAAMPAAAAARRGSIYVHLLAGTLEARRALVDDLRPAPHLALAA